MCNIADFFFSVFNSNIILLKVSLRIIINLYNLFYLRKKLHRTKLKIFIMYKVETRTERKNLLIVFIFFALLWSVRIFHLLSRHFFGMKSAEDYLFDILPLCLNWQSKTQLHSVAENILRQTKKKNPNENEKCFRQSKK